MQIEESIKVVEVMALDMGPPVVLDEGCPLHEVIQRLRDASSGCALLTRDGRSPHAPHRNDLTQSRIARGWRQV